MNRYFAAALIAALVISPMLVEAKGSSGGRSSGSSSRSSSASRPAMVKPSAPSSPVATAPKPAANKPSANTTRQQAAVAPSANGKTYSKTGNVVDSNYAPKFRGGYMPPNGSVVYYPDNSWMMWIPLMYLMQNDSHRDAIVQEKDGEGNTVAEKIVQEEGVDTMYVINWIITILIGLGLLALIVWLINKFTSRPKYTYV